MDKEFQTSFVPKKTVIEREVSHTHSSFSGVANIIALVIFIASILMARGAYFYRGSMEDKVANYKDSLQRARASFEPALITELQVLDKRMRAAGEILENHIAVSPIFTLLGDITLPTVRYSDFSYEFNKENSNLVDVEINGEAKGYNFIALQADLFGDNKFIKNPIFSEFTLDQLGNVDFKLTFSVDKSLVLYESFLEREASLGEDFDPTAVGDPFAPDVPAANPTDEELMQAAHPDGTTNDPNLPY